MLPTRTARRYHTSLPVKISHHTREDVFCTHAVSANGCVVCGPKPDWLTKECAISLALGSADLDLTSVAVGDEREGGFHLHWDLSFDETRRLVEYLEQVDHEPEAATKAAYLQSENELIQKEIQHIEEQRRRGYQFLYLLVGAYFAFLVAPYKLFTQAATEVLLFYAIAGLWLSIMVLFHTSRFFDFLANSVRRRAQLYKAIAANRGWLFALDPVYYGKTILPLGNHFDDHRAWKARYSDDRERYAQWIAYHRTTGAFIIFLQAFFVMGIVYFLSIVLRGYQVRVIDDQHVIPLGPANTLDIFKLEYYLRALVVFAFIPVAWLQITTNKWLQMAKKIWEARRIDSKRPNPRFIDRALREQHPVVYRTGVVLLAIVGAYATSGLLLLFWPFLATRLYFEHVLDWRMLLAVCTTFLAFKYVYARMVLRCGTIADKSFIRPIRQPEGR